MPTLNSLIMVESQSQDYLHFWTTHFEKLAALVTVVPNLHPLKSKGLNNCYTRLSSQPVLPQYTPYRCFYDRCLNTRHAYSTNISNRIFYLQTCKHEEATTYQLLKSSAVIHAYVVHHVHCTTNKKPDRLL